MEFKKTMKRATVAVLVLFTAIAAAFAAPSAQTSSTPLFPKVLINAKYVYVTSYDGDQYNFNILPGDRQAIASVQDAIQKWGHYVLVYRPQDADMIIAVQKRGSEDVLAVYDARGPQDTWLWRVMGHGGLDKGELPLFAKLQSAVEQASK
jgi:hypothetical protein